MNRLETIVQLVRCMGPGWLLYRCGYALRQKLGWDAWRRPVSTWDAAPLAACLNKKTPTDPAAYREFRRQSAVRFFFPSTRPEECGPLFQAWDAGRDVAIHSAERIKRGEFQLFEHAWVSCGQTPDWHRNPVTCQQSPAEGHWSKLDEFGFGDIKMVWELNRFGFVFPLVRAYWRTGDESLAERFWQLVEDWRGRNPPRAGANWKCGQEAALRAMAWCFGLYGFAGAAASSPERLVLLARMLAETGRRIESNFRYALSQQNNHGISEAAGLFTLGVLFPEFRRSAKWRKVGRTALERQARELIYDDGGFVQHSLNYHRLMLDDYLWCIQLGRLNGNDLSPELLARVKKAGDFLACLTDRESGRVPNWGANDGAHVLPLSNCGYLDYRPAVQAVAAIAGRTPCLPPGPWDEKAWWLGAAVSQRTPAQVDAENVRQDFPDSGLTVLRNGSLKAVLRTVRRFRHRPAQCDLLHLDLWVGKNNVLCDSGSYSYNSPDGSPGYFKSVAAHNTIQFDGHDQMPKLGRFMYGHWPQGEVSLPTEQPRSVTASYGDWRGYRYERTVELQTGRCHVTDRISGFKEQAVARWHLAAGVEWSLTEDRCTSPWATIQIAAEGRIKSIRLTESWESLFYCAKTPLKVLEVTVAPGCRKLQTEIAIAAQAETGALMARRKE